MKQTNNKKSTVNVKANNRTWRDICSDSSEVLSVDDFFADSFALFIKLSLWRSGSDLVNEKCLSKNQEDQVRSIRSWRHLPNRNNPSSDWFNSQSVCVCLNESVFQRVSFYSTRTTTSLTVGWLKSNEFVEPKTWRNLRITLQKLDCCLWPHACRCTRIFL